MNDKYYTPDGQHPEDAIYHAKCFINELTRVQETYFQKLVSDLNLDNQGEDWLFDYIHNSGEEGELLCFDEYLNEHQKSYESFVKKNKKKSKEVPFHNNSNEEPPFEKFDVL